MAKVNQRTKHIHLNLLQGNFTLPADNQKIVRVVCARGNGIFEVAEPDGTGHLALLPYKFNKTVWVKRNGFLIADVIQQPYTKCDMEIVQVLTADYVKFLKREGVFPKEFDGDEEQCQNGDGDKGETNLKCGDDEGSEDESDLFVNTNRRHVYEDSSSSSEEE